MVADVGKMCLLGIALLGGFVLAIMGGIVHDTQMMTAGVGVIATALGYLAGNGVNAVRGQAPSPVFVPRPETIDAQNATNTDPETDS